MNLCFVSFLLLTLLIFATQSQKPNGIKSTLETAVQNDDFGNLITDILVKSLLPYKCVAIICDTMYHEVFQQKLFKQFGVYLSYIIILVQESEDLLSPNENAQELLNMAKEQGCQFYIILLANGIQVKRLLNFGDRYRVLNTRANYMMLWDRRLFEKELHYIWKRIINIIFIREYVGVAKATHKATPWFEISTVPFPSPIKGVLVPRRLDIWRAGKFRSGIDLFRDKTSDLQNQTLRVVTFSHVPAMTKIEMPEGKTVRTVLAAGSGAMGYVGIEIEVLQTLSETMNFNPDIYEPVNADVEMWGFRQTDGQYTGLLGEMVKSLADIALGDIHYTPYFLKLMDLSTPYNTECLTFLTPESLTNNSWKTLILPFKPLMWAAIVICLSTTGFIFYGLSRFHKKLNEVNDINIKEIKEAHVQKNLSTQVIPPYNDLSLNEKYILMKQQYDAIKIEGEPEGVYVFGELSNSFLYTLSMLLLISLPKLPTGWSLRMLTGWYYLYCILLVVAYKASMTAILANPAPRVTIDTLQELVDSGLECGGWGEINREFFKTSLDPASQVIGSKFEIINDSDIAIDRIAKGSFAFYENAHFLEHASVKKRLKSQMVQSNLKSNNTESNENKETPKGDHNLHIMSDCVIHMPISIGLQKNSPIKPRVDKFIRRVFEAGLIKKWLDDVMLPTTNGEIHLGPTDTTNALMSMEKLFGAVVALLVGYFISVSVLIGEILYFEFVTKKHPHFDKYSRQICIVDKK